MFGGIALDRALTRDVVLKRLSVKVYLDDRHVEDPVSLLGSRARVLFRSRYPVVPDSR